MTKTMELLSEKRTHLAEKRTELSYERTVLAYIRTAATIIMFGVAFLGLSENKGDMLFYSGLIAITLGVLFLVVAMISGTKHLKEIRNISFFFKHLVDFKFKKKDS